MGLRVLTTRLLDYEDFLLMEQWLELNPKFITKPSIEVHDWDKHPEEQHFQASVAFRDDGLAAYFKLTWC